MSELNIFIADWLKGKSIYPAVRRVINMLFCISISSYVFENIYFKYTWLNITDYKGILNFFIKGDFFIPMSLFIMVYGITYYGPLGIFYLFNHIKVVKLERKILAYELNRPKVDSKLENIEDISRVITSLDLTKSLITNLYKELRTHIKPQALIRFQRKLDEYKVSISENFIMAFRGLIAITIYFISLNYFGVFLYTTVILLIFTYLFFLMLVYRFYDILPTLIRKFQIEADKYIQEQIK